MQDFCIAHFESAGNQVFKLPKNVTSRDWAKIRRLVMSQATVCALCGRPLVPEAPPRSPWSTAVDHRIPRNVFMELPLSQQREYFLNPNNLQVVHMKCNSAKGDGTGKGNEPVVSAATLMGPLTGSSATVMGPPFRQSWDHPWIHHRQP
jgi:hypothetical protein